MEMWKDVKGYEGVYQVSNYGNVRSLSRIQTDKNGRNVQYQSKVLTPQPNSQGYMRVGLKLNGKQKYWFVHRLVALHFVDNPNFQKYAIVNHLDSNYLNNKADNLEWTDISGNNHHAIEVGRMKRTEEWLHHQRQSNEKNGRPVIGTNIATGETVRFVCLNDCKNAGFQPSCVCNCCQGTRKSHKGYTWRYEDV